MKHFFIDHLSRPFIFNQCLSCQRFMINKNSYCPSCWKFIFNHSHSYPHKINTSSFTLNIYPLLNWSRENNPLIYPLIHQIKSGVNHSLSNWLAKNWLFQYGHLGLFNDPKINSKKPLLFIPAPTLRKHNQAYDLAKGLADLLGGQAADILALTPQSSSDLSISQKSLNKLQRVNRKIEIKISDDELLFFQSHFKIVIVDDVVTTGATALACIKALKIISPPIVCIAYRVKTSVH